MRAKIFPLRVNVKQFGRSIGSRAILVLGLGLTTVWACVLGYQLFRFVGYLISIPFA
jgi:hypothetical protein